MTNDKPLIIYEDDDLLVVNKPFGMVVNKADTTREETVQDWVEDKLQSADSQPQIAAGDFIKRGGIVHRLDKDTSGVLIIAKNEFSFLNLQNQFKERKVKKTYLALVHGIPVPSGGIINAPIERNPFNRMRFGVFPGGRDAVTEYKSIFNYQLTGGKQKTDARYTLLEVLPHTGRTHQIRVHLKHINHAIVSDVLYAGRKAYANDLIFCPRMFLHAKGIEFMHPKTNNIVKMEAVLPDELDAALHRLVKLN